ncbi:MULTISPECIES: cupin domain-containing protein [Halomonadaceae]|nr:MULTISPECIES: cupin domain-containing protein [Halomonas]
MKKYITATAIAVTLATAGCSMHGHQASPSPAATPDRAAVIEGLGLEKHVEGGYFRRTYQSDHRPMLETEAGERFLMTSIFYLLTSDSPVGHFHRNRSDIVHYYHQGDPIRYTLIHPDGTLEQVVMGPDVANGQRLQLHVAGGVWKASELLEGPYGYGLISEAVSPGFDYDDMTLGDAETLRTQFPEHEGLFEPLTRK